MKKLIVLLLIPVLGAAQMPQKISRIDSVLTYLHEQQLFNGTILIGEKGKVVYKKAFGLKNAGTGEKLSTTSAFNLASVSKQFYAMMIMMLKEQGKLQYDDPVQKFLPLFPYPVITLRHLLNQTSGLSEYFDMADGQMTYMDTLTNNSMLEMLATKRPPLRFQPGEQWEYCNTNYVTLGAVLEKASGTTADIFLRQFITQPLKMNDTYVYQIKMKSSPASRVFGFRNEGGKHVANDLIRYDGVVGDGNVYSSVEDLYKWDQALYTEKLVKKANFQEAITPGRLNNGKPTKYGFGWFIDEPGKLVSHSGGWVAFRTIIVRNIGQNQTLIVLDNSTNSQGLMAAKSIWEGKPNKLPVTHLISNVKIIDGTGLPYFTGGVRLLNDRVWEVGDLKPLPNEKVTDGKGFVLAPGFIDNHSHHDWGLRESPACIAATNQGITTIVIGQDGGSSPVDSIQAMIKSRPVSVNMATYTGHASLRMMTMGKNLFRNATSAEIDSMKRLLALEINKGSLGLSTGLEYEQAFYSNRDEVVALAKVAGEKGGRYISHMRSEDMRLEEAIDELIDIGREARIPVQISHFKIAMRSKWGNSVSILNRLQQARLEGVNITADVYPYPMWASTPRVLFPKKDFDNPASAKLATEEFFDPAASVMISYPDHPEYEGKTVTEIGKMNQEGPEQALMRIIRETSDKGAGIMGTSMSETDISNFLRWPYSSICSDGASDGHPRGHGAFTRVLGRYVREQKLMPLETAIHKMTGLAAEHVGIQNRGIIAPGYFADLVLFDPATVIDNATIRNPRALSTGIDKVWVNGQVVYEQQKAVANYPGKFVTRGGAYD